MTALPLRAEMTAANLWFFFAENSLGLRVSTTNT